MAQVRKFKNGGAHLYIDNRDIEMNDENLTQLYDYVSQANSELKPHLGYIVNSLQNGQDRTINSVSNSIKGTGLFDYYSDSDVKALKKENPNGRWDATVGNVRDQLARAVAYLSRFRPTTKTEDKKEESTKSKISIYGDPIELTYDTADDGTVTFSDTNYNNANAIGRINTIFNYLGSDFDARTNGYQFDSHYTDQLKAGLDSWYSVLENKEGYKSELLNRMRSNTLTSADKSFLDALNIDYSASGKNKKDEVEAKWKSVDGWKGNLDALAANNIILTKNDDGSISVSGDNPYASATWYLGGVDWTQGTDYANGAIYNGRLYSWNDIMSGKYKDVVEALTPFVNRDNTLTHDAWWNRAKASGVRFVGDNADYGWVSFNPNESYNTVLSNVFSTDKYKNGVAIRDLTSYLPEGDNRQLYAYLSPDGERNEWGILTPKYLLIDENGKPLHISESELASNNVALRNDIFGFATNPIITTPWRWVNNKQYAEYVKLPTNDTVVVDRDGKFYLAKTDPEGNFIKVDEIYHIDEMLDYIQNGYQGQGSNENKYIESWTKRGSRFRQTLNHPVSRAILGPFGVIPATIEATSVSNLNRKPTVGNVALRSALGPLSVIPATRDMLDTPKYQYGGSIQQAQTKEEVKDDPITSSYNKAHALDGSDGGLTQAEWNKIYTAIADVAGVGIAVAGGEVGNAIGAAIGAGASTSRFVMDIKDDGFQGKDLTKYIGNLLLDAATVIPFAGKGAKAAKAIKAIQWAGKPLIKALTAAGVAVPVITAIRKAQNNEKLTSEDLTLAIQGLGSAILGGKMIRDKVGEAKLARDISKKLKTSNEVTKLVAKSSVKVGDQTLNLDHLSPAQLKAMVDEAGDEAALVEKAIQALKTKHPDVDLTGEDVHKQVVKMLQDYGVEFKSAATGVARATKAASPFKQTFNEKEVEMTAEEVGNLVGKTKEEVKEILKPKFKNGETDITDADLNKALDKLGFTWKDNKAELPKSKAKFTITKKNKASVDVDSEEHSGWYYYWRQAERNRMLGTANATPGAPTGKLFQKVGRWKNQKGHLDLITREEMNAANAAAAKGMFHGTVQQRALSRFGVQNPSSFTFYNNGDYGLQQVNTGLSTGAHYVRVPGVQYESPKAVVFNDPTKLSQQPLALPKPRYIIPTATERGRGVLPSSNEPIITPPPTFLALPKPRYESPVTTVAPMLALPKPRYVTPIVRQFGELPGSNEPIALPGSRQSLIDVLATSKKPSRTVLRMRKPYNHTTKQKGKKKITKSANGGILKAQDGTQLNWNDVNSWDAQTIARRRGSLSDDEWTEMTTLMQKYQNSNSLSEDENKRLNELATKVNPSASTSDSKFERDNEELLSRPLDPSKIIGPLDTRTREQIMSEYDENGDIKHTGVEEDDYTHGVDSPYPINTKSIRSLIRADLTRRAYDDAHKNLEDAIKAGFLNMKVAPIYGVPTVSDKGVTRTGMAQLAQARQTIPSFTSDRKLNQSLNNDREHKLNEEELKISQKAQDAINTAMANAANVTAKNTASIVNAANENRAQNAKTESALSQAKAAAKQEKFVQVTKPLMEEFERTIQEKSKSAQDIVSRMMLGKFNAEADALQSQLLADRRAEWLNSEEKKKGASFDDWMLSDTDRAEEYHKIKQRVNNTMAQKTYDYQVAGLPLYAQNIAKRMSRTANIYYQKKGGKVSNSAYEPIPLTDKLTLEQQKAVHKAVENMSKSLLRRLEKLI